MVTECLKPGLAPRLHSQLVVMSFKQHPATGEIMKKILVFSLILSALASTSFALAPSKHQLQEYKFKFMDLEFKKTLFEKTVQAQSQEEAQEKAAVACFADLRKQKVPGLDAIDICVNPRS